MPPKQDTYYTASMRFDTEWPKRPKSPKKYLAALLKRVLDDTRLRGTRYEATLPHRPETSGEAVAAFGHLCLRGDDGEGRMPGYWDFHAGDFVLAARSRWEQVGAYPETSYTFGVDSAMLCKFHGRGLRNAVLLPPCFVAHQHHVIMGAAKVVEPDRICERCQRAPLQRFEPRQRDPELWGRHSADDIQELGFRNLGRLGSDRYPSFSSNRFLFLEGGDAGTPIINTFAQKFALPVASCSFPCFEELELLRGGAPGS